MKRIFVLVLMFFSCAQKSAAQQGEPYSQEWQEAFEVHGVYEISDPQNCFFRPFGPTSVAAHRGSVVIKEVCTFIETENESVSVREELTVVEFDGEAVFRTPLNQALQLRRVLRTGTVCENGDILFTTRRSFREPERTTIVSHIVLEQGSGNLLSNQIYEFQELAPSRLRVSNPANGHLVQAFSDGNWSESDCEGMAFSSNQHFVERYIHQSHWYNDSVLLLATFPGYPDIINRPDYDQIVWGFDVHSNEVSEFAEIVRSEQVGSYLTSVSDQDHILVRPGAFDRQTSEGASLAHGHMPNIRGQCEFHRQSNQTICRLADLSYVLVGMDGKAKFFDPERELGFVDYSQKFQVSNGFIAVIGRTNVALISLN